MKLILASQSPRRKELLSGLLEGTGITFTTLPADVDESTRKGEPPLTYVQRVADTKALKIASENPGSVVIAADTPLIVGRRILQKAESFEEACAMLKLQSGKRVHIPTAVAVVDTKGKIHRKLNESWIKFKPLSDKEIKDYLSDSQNWQGISAAVQVENPHMASMISTMHGSYSGILGLPLYETRVLLARCGVV